MSASQPPLDRLIRSVYEISRIMRQQMLCEGRDVNFLQIHALLVISEQPGITMKELAGALRMSSPSATSLVNRLVKLKRVERRHDPHNRKLVRLKLTKDGQAELRRAHRERSTVIRQIFVLLSPQEQRMLAELHEKLLRSWEASHRIPPSRP